MKISGFTIIRNAINFDYPVVEAITSVLPLCDEFVVAVGKSEDETLDLIKKIDSPKIKIIETLWDDHLREGGRVLALETDKAYRAISPDTDWCFYIQSDEVIHEQDYVAIRSAMEQYLDDKKVEGLVFNYHHFYGSYDYLGASRKWYKQEVRIVRNIKNIYSYRDAQGFRIDDNRKLNVKSIAACVYHYGWVKHPKFQQAKQESFHKMWHSDEWMNKNIQRTSEFDYSQIDSLKKFNGTHPKVMQNRVQKQNWKFDFDLSKDKTPLKYRLIGILEALLRRDIGRYKNFKLI